MQHVDFQLLSNIAVSLGLPVYHGHSEYEGRDYPNVTIDIKADSTGYYVYLHPGFTNETDFITELIDSLEWAFKRHDLDFTANGAVVIGGYRAFEYEIWK